MYLNWSRAGRECEESEYRWQAVAVCCKWCSLPLPRLCVLQRSGLRRPLPVQPPFPLHSELSLSFSLPLAEETTHIDRAYSGGGGMEGFNPSILDPKCHFEGIDILRNSIPSLKGQVTPKIKNTYFSLMCVIYRCCANHTSHRRERPSQGWEALSANIDGVLSWFI